MAFLTLGSGGSAITLSVVDISEQEPELIGDETRSSNGTLRGVYTAEKRKWTMTLLEMTETDLISLRALLALGAHVPAEGDAISAGPLTVRGYLRDLPYVYQSTDHLRVARLDLVQV